MYCNAPRSEVTDAEHAADDVPAQIIKDQDLPYGIAIGVQDRSGLGRNAVRGRPVVEPVIVLGRLMVEVQDLLDGR